VLVWLSTGRPRVQIPLEALLGPWCNGNIPGSNPVDQGSNPCGPAQRHGTQSGQAQTLAIDCGFDSHPCHCECIGWALASPSGCNPPAIAVQVQLLPGALMGRSSSGEDAGFSSRIEGFDSPTAYCVIAGGPESSGG
jgi:hypothetical protein